MASAIRSDTKLVYICNPNNPIPTIVEKNALRDFVLEVSRDRMVFVDEAYHEFVDNPDYSSMMDLVRKGTATLLLPVPRPRFTVWPGCGSASASPTPDLAAEINRRMTGTPTLWDARCARQLPR